VLNRNVMTDDEETRWFRADVRDLRPGQDATQTPHWGSRYVYVTSNLEVARAFAAQRGNRSVYEVELAGFIYDDPDYPPECGAGCAMCDWATVVRLIEEEVDMTLDDAWKLMSRYLVWSDLSRMYDDDGYATASPEMRAIGRGADELRQLGRYPMSEVVRKLVREICAH
jgi:hypothetical protein